MRNALAKQISRRVTHVAGMWLCVLLTIGIPGGTLLAAPPLPPARVSTEQILQIRERMHGTAERIVRNFLLSKGIPSSTMSVVVDFALDREKLRADSLAYYQEWYTSVSNEATESQRQDFAQQKTNIEELAKLLGLREDPQATAPAQGAKQPPESGQPSSNVRLGSFNLDLLGMTYADPVSVTQDSNTTAKPGTNDGNQRLPFSLAVQIPGRTNLLAVTPPPFTFDLADYITDVTAAVTLPHDVPAEMDDELRQTLAKGLGVNATMRTSLVNKITLTRAPEPKVIAPEATPTPSFSQELFKPQSAFIPTLVATLIGAVTLLLAAVLIAGGFSKLARGLAELKPESSKETTDSGGDKTNDTASTPIVAASATHDGGTGDSGDDSNVDSNAASRLLAADMTMVRTQVLDLIEQNAPIVAEIIRDILNSNEGRDDLKDLMTFVGYDALAPSLNLLPKRLLNEFSAYLEDNGSGRSNPLNGIEVAQRLSRESASRNSKTTGTENSEELMELRHELLTTDDNVMEKVFATSNPVECTLLLQTMSMERTQKSISHFPREVFREAYGQIDSTIPERENVAKKLMEKIVAVRKENVVKSAQAQKRIMMKILKNATVEDEEFIGSLVANDDWEMKSLMMKTRFLFRDLPYVQTGIVKQAFESFPFAFRAELTFCCDEDKRKFFIDLYPEGVRARDMLKAEIEQIEKSEKRKEKALKSRNDTVEQFITMLHQVILGDAKNIDEILLRQAQALGVTPPEGDATSSNAKAA